jgi:hypothetical protein
MENPIEGASSPIPAPKGLGWGPGSNLPGVQDFLYMGFPRLALARAKCVPFAPYAIPLQATFDNPDVDSIPNVGSEIKISQDTYVDAMLFRVTRDKVSSNIFQAERDFYYNYQSGIEATLDVLGAPRYTIAPVFTDMSLLGDVIANGGKWPCGFVLTYQQQLQMSFNARIQLADFPTTITVLFRAWLPNGEEFVQMSPREALDRLQNEHGVVIPPGFTPIGR